MNKSPWSSNTKIRTPLGGGPLPSFCDWFVTALKSAMEVPDAPVANDADYARRLLLTMARHFWRDVPMPDNRWRTWARPRIERRERCDCGSGRTFKPCCGDLADMPPVLDPRHALVLVIGSLAPGQLGVSADGDVAGRRTWSMAPDRQ